MPKYGRSASGHKTQQSARSRPPIFGHEECVMSQLVMSQLIFGHEGTNGTMGQQKEGELIFEEISLEELPMEPKVTKMESFRFC